MSTKLHCNYSFYCMFKIIESKYNILRSENDDKIFVQ